MQLNYITHEISEYYKQVLPQFIKKRKVKISSYVALLDLCKCNNKKFSYCILFEKKTHYCIYCVLMCLIFIYQQAVI